MIQRARALGTSGVHLSAVSLGTMRLADAGLDARAVCDLLLQGADLGVTTLHSSAEYSSFRLLCEALALAEKARPGWEPTHVVKLAEPGFGEDRFEVERFRANVDAYRAALGAERLAVVQWMARHDLADHPGRIAIIVRDAPEIAAACRQAVTDGSVGAVVAFPYDPSEIAVEIEAEWCDGLALYLNPAEVPSLGVLDRCASVGGGVLGIRPLAAGRLPADEEATWSALAPTRAEAAVRFALLHPAVATTIVGVSRPGHLVEVARAADQIPSAREFARVAGGLARA